MQFSKKATSLIEALIIMTVVSFGIVWVYNFFVSSERLADNTNKRIKAIQIAREWIEWITNIRNTNWLIYPGDYENCWNVQNYNINCIWDNSFAYDISPWSYIIRQDSEFRWHLDGKSTATTFPALEYRQRFWVEITANGFYNQQIADYANPAYTREIIISYPVDTNTDGSNNSNDEELLVRSLVQWGVASQHRVELSHTLTNWKNKD